MGAKHIRLHDMRHSFASILLNQGVSAEKVAHWLGHASTRLVHRVYGHLLAYDEAIDTVTFAAEAPAKIVKFPAS